MLCAVDELAEIKHSMLNTYNIRRILNKAHIEPVKLIDDDSIESASMDLILQINRLFNESAKGRYNS